MNAFVTARNATILAFLATAAAAAPVREVEITPDPIDNGQQVFTLRIKPGETRSYERMTFDCTYRQEYISQTTDTQGSKVINEPAAFTYRRKDVKLVDDLDCYISFRVPVDLAKLSDMYGRTTFSTNAPVRIARIKITAFTADGKAWSFDLEASGLHKLDTITPAATPSKP